MRGELAASDIGGLSQQFSREQSWRKLRRIFTRSSHRCHRAVAACGAMSCTRGSEIEAKMRCGLEARFALLKQGLLLERLDEIAQPETHALVIQQASEAASLAWLTGYALL